MIYGNTKDETNFSRKLSLTGSQISKLSKTFTNNLTTYIKLSNTQLSEIIQSG